MTKVRRSATVALAVSMLAAACSSGGAGTTTAPPAPTTVASSVAASAATTQPASTSTSTVPLASPSSTAAPFAQCSGATTGPITVWHSFAGDATLKAFDRLVARYNATGTGTVEAVKVGGYEDLLKKLGSTPVEQWPDVVIGPSDGTVNLVRSGHFLRPNDCADVAARRADLLPVVDATYTVAGELVAVPYGVSAPVLMFDAAEFRRAGLDPAAPPATLDALLDTSRRIVAAGASPHGLVLYDHFGEWILQQYAAKRGQVLGEPGNGRDLERVTMRYDSPAIAVDAAALRRGVRDGHVLWIGGLKADIDDLIAIVDPVNGGAMTIHTSASLGEIVDLFAAGNFNGAELGVAPMPGPGPGSLAGGNALYLVDHNDPSRAARAWALIDWLSAPAQLAEFDAASGYVPPDRATASEPALTARWAAAPQLRVAYDQLVATPGSPATAGTLIGPSVDRDYTLYSASRRLIDTDDPVETVLQETATLVNNLIAAAG